MSPRGKLVASTLLGAALLAGLLTYVGWGEVARAVRNARPGFVLLAVLSYAAFFVVRGVRWRVLLKPVKPVSVANATGATAVGWLVNTVVPMRAGEVARAALLDRKEGTGVVAALSSIAVERALDLMGIGLLAVVGLYLMPLETTLPHWFYLGLKIAWAAPLVGLACLAYGVRRRERFMGLVERALRPLPGGARERLLGMGEAVLDGAAVLSKNPRVLLVVAPLTVLMTIFQALIYVCLFLALEPSGDPLLLFAGVPFFLLSFAVAITPGYVGTYEVAFAAVFGALGYPASVVVPVGALTHVFTTCIVILLGSVSVVALGTNLRAITQPPESEASPEGA